MARSIKKGPFIDESLLKKIEALNAANKKQVIKTWSLTENFSAWLETGAEKGAQNAPVDG